MLICLVASYLDSVVSSPVPSASPILQASESPSTSVLTRFDGKPMPISIEDFISRYNCLFLSFVAKQKL
jgi:hypothetical protein